MAEDQFAQLCNNITDKLGNLGLNDLVPVFEGDSAKFKDWIKSIEKCAVVNNLPEVKNKLLAYRFSTGVVSDFLHRYLSDNPNSTWTQMKAELGQRFGEVRDTYLQFAMLRNIKQKRGENIQNFAERVISLAQEAYSEYDAGLNIIDHQIVGFFIDGLSDENIKHKLIRENPRTFQNAVTSAVNEQNVKVRCKLRSSPQIQSFRHANHDVYEEMEIDHFRRGRYCTFCRQQNHSTAECRKRRGQIHEVHDELNRQNGEQRQNGRSRRNNNSQNFGSRDRIQCWFCGKLGHVKADCEEYKQLQSQAPRFRQSQRKN